MECKDPSLDTNSPLTTLDVALMNTDLVESLVTVMQEQIISDSNTTNPALTSNKKKIDITETLQYNSQPTKNSLSTDIYIEASELTPAEQLAQEVTYTRK
jgi:hypothetical protein